MLVPIMRWAVEVIFGYPGETDVFEAISNKETHDQNKRTVKSRTFALFTGGSYVSTMTDY